MNSFLAYLKHNPSGLFVAISRGVYLVILFYPENKAMQRKFLSFLIINGLNMACYLLLTHI